MDGTGGGGADGGGGARLLVGGPGGAGRLACRNGLGAGWRSGSRGRQ